MTLLSPEEQFNTPDLISTTVTVKWGFWDRIKILLFGTSVSRVQIRTQHVVGNTTTFAASWTPPLFKGKPRGYMEIGPLPGRKPTDEELEEFWEVEHDKRTGLQRFPDDVATND